MSQDALLTMIDEELGKLRQARAMLTEGELSSAKTLPSRRNKTAASLSPKPASSPRLTSKRVLSEEARAKIAAAQKKRWSKAKRSK